MSVPGGLPEGPVPPGDYFFGEKCEKINADNSTHVGPQQSFNKAELKLKNNQGKGRGKFEGTEEYGGENLYQGQWVIK